MDTNRDLLCDAQDAADAADERLGRRCTYNVSRDIHELVDTSQGAQVTRALALALLNEKSCLESEGFIVDSIGFGYTYEDRTLSIVECRYNGGHSEAIEKLDECGYAYPDTNEVA